MRSKYPLRIRTNTSGSMLSLRVVKPTRSANKVVTSLRSPCSATPPATTRSTISSGAKRANEICRFSRSRDFASSAARSALARERLRHQASPDASAIGIDNQGESCLAWHADSKQPLTPVIVWQDNRSHAAIEALKAQGHEARVLELAGLPLDSYFSASKFAWILQHCSEAKALLREGKLRMGTTDAYFLDRLAGRFVTDISTASSDNRVMSSDWLKIISDNRATSTGERSG